MGVITYLFHRSEAITPQRFNVFFLDVGENIHIHYRDLRIELSTGEFEEIAAGFEKYAPSVLDMIRNQGYRDGVLPNTNAQDTLKTFWDKSNLAHPVKYNARRLSIEENVDGYHVHFRNYKLLLDRDSFKEFAHGMAMAMLQLDNRPPVDPVYLLKVNDLAPEVLASKHQDGEEHIDLLLDKAYLGKADQVLTGAGFARQGAKREGFFAKGRQKVRLHSAPPVATPAGRAGQGNGLVDLPSFIDGQASNLAAEPLNELKLKLLYLFKRAEAGHIPPFRIDDVVIDVESNTPSVNLFRHGGAVDPKKEYGRLSELLSRKKLFFIKPGKRYYNQEQRHALNERFERHVRETIGVNPCVNRVHLLGSSTRDRSGAYAVPFVHFDWAKLASDYDLLIELEPDYENDIPPSWEKKFDWPRSGCYYAHLGDLGNGMSSTYAETYPGIRFFEQMLETYLFYPSQGRRAVKDDFLSKSTTRIVFERPGLIDWFERQYPLKITRIKRIPIPSFNKVYDLSSDSERFVLKIYPDGNRQGGQYQLLAYEMALLEGYRELDLPVAAPVANGTGVDISPHPDGKAVLFRYIDGKYLHEPGKEDAYLAGQLLARLHLYSDQLSIAPDVTPPRIMETLLYWLKAYRDFVDKKLLPEVPDLARHLDTLRQLGTRVVHCHGDVTPRNFLYREGQCWLIDFQMAGLGPAILDLADGMIEFAARGRHFNQEAMAAFLAGYRSIRKLDDDEELNLPRLLPCQLLAKQARTARAHDHGFAWNGDLIATLQRGMALLGGTGTGVTDTDSADRKADYSNGSVVQS